MKKIISVVIAIIVVGGISFYGGMKYDQSKKTNSGGNFANLTQAERQQRFAQMGGGAGGVRRDGVGSGGFVNGELISIDNGSMILKSNDGGSKVVIFSTSTQIMKSTIGTIGDLKVGDNLMIISSANQDGSVTAQTIQIRPIISTSTSTKN